MTRGASSSKGRSAGVRGVRAWVALGFLAWAGLCPLAAKEGRKKDKLLEEVVRSPHAGNLALLASRAGCQLRDVDAVKTVLEHLDKAGSQEKRRELLEQMGLVVDHEQLVKDAEAKFRKACGKKVIVRDSRYYRILSTVNERHTTLAQDHMDAIHLKYREIFKFRDKPDERFLLYVFLDRAEFDRLDPEAPEWAGAYYSPRDRALICVFPEDRKDFSAFYHEGFHQFIHYYYPNLPAWVDEGLATYFEMSELKIIKGVRGGPNFNFITGKVGEYHVKFLKDILEAGEERPLEEVLKLDYKEFYSDDEAFYSPKYGQRIKEVDVHYPQAWSVVHFLIHGNRGRNRALLLVYLQDLRTGKYPEEVNEKFFRKVNEEKFTGAWKAYVETLE